MGLYMFLYFRPKLRKLILAHVVVHMFTNFLVLLLFICIYIYIYIYIKLLICIFIIIILGIIIVKRPRTIIWMGCYIRNKLLLLLFTG